MSLVALRRWTAAHRAHAAREGHAPRCCSGGAAQQPCQHSQLQPALPTTCAGRGQRPPPPLSPCRCWCLLQASRPTARSVATLVPAMAALESTASTRAAAVTPVASTTTGERGRPFCPLLYPPRHGMWCTAGGSWLEEQASTAHSFALCSIMFDKYHPGYFGKVGMRYFHLNKNKYFCPVINLDKVRGSML